MALYTITLTKKAKKSLDKIQSNKTKPIFDAILKLGENPRPKGYKKLSGRDGFRIRVGDYRIIYEIIDSELIIDIINLGHRKNIYE